MTAEKAQEAVVYAWAKRDDRVVGARYLDSSYDRYDTEYGWTAEDYRRAAGGIDISYYRIGLGVYSLTTGRYTDFALRPVGVLIGSRYDDVPDEQIQKALEGCTILVERGDGVAFHRSGNALRDMGKYGIFDTLTNQQLSPPSSATSDWRHHLKPFTFEVNGTQFTVDNQCFKDYLLVESSRIVTADQEVIWKGNYSQYIVAAVGFPEDILLERFPRLRTALR